MFDLFTELAKRVIVASEDVLLGLLAESEGTALQVLSALDVDAAALRQSVLDRVARPALEGQAVGD